MAPAPDALTQTNSRFVGTHGIWQEVINRTPGPVRRGTLFLDRDGVLVKEVPYLHRIEDARLVDGAVNAIRVANGLQIPVILITNQGGIGLGKYGWPDFARLQQWIYQQLADQDAFLNGTFACPYHPKGLGDLQHPDHPDRKPNPGMLERAATMFPVDLRQSWMVGDRDLDVHAGRAAGLAGGIIVASEHSDSATSRGAAATLAREDFKVIDCGNRDRLAEALAPLWNHAGR